MKLEQIIASSCRQRMILALFGAKEMHLNKLIRTLNSTYNEVNRNVQILENEGVIKLTRLGRLKIIELERTNPKTEKLIKSLRILADKS